MPLSNITYDLPPHALPSVLKENGIEYGFIGNVQRFKYEYRPDMKDRATRDACRKSGDWNALPIDLKNQ